MLIQNILLLVYNNLNVLAKTFFIHVFRDTFQSPALFCRDYRKDKRVSRYREVLSKFIQGIRNCDESKVREMGQEIRRAKKYLDNFEWMDSRPYLWATTAAGFVPVLGQIVGGATVALKEVRELVEKRHNWIYLGYK